MEECSFVELANMHLVYGASNGNSRASERLYAERYPGRRVPNHRTFLSIDRHLRGPIAWPPRSPDLTPLDFCMWGHLKSSVYETPFVSEKDLVARILVAADQLQHKYGVFQRMRDALARRCVSCIEAGGRMFEQYL